MKYKQSVFAIAGMAAIALHAAQMDYRDSSLTVEERVGDLLGRMTIHPSFLVIPFIGQTCLRLAVISR